MNQETYDLILALKAKHPQHIVQLCTNGNVGRWRRQRYLTGKGSAYTGKGVTVYRNVLLAVYPPTFKVQ